MNDTLKMLLEDHHQSYALIKIENSHFRVVNIRQFNVLNCIYIVHEKQTFSILVSFVNSEHCFTAFKDKLHMITILLPLLWLSLNEYVWLQTLHSSDCQRPCSSSHRLQHEKATVSFTLLYPCEEKHRQLICQYKYSKCG